MLELDVQGLVDFGMKQFVEIVHFLVPGEFAFGDVVEFLLDAGCEIIVEYVGEKFGQECVDDSSNVGRYQFALFRSDRFGLFLFGDPAFF